jgi:hypothetical protein
MPPLTHELPLPPSLPLPRQVSWFNLYFVLKNKWCPACEQYLDALLA